MWFKKLWIIGLLSIISAQAYAFHIIGGELIYTRTTGNNYEITLKIYRDCADPEAAEFDNPLQIYVYDALGLLVQTLDISFPGSEFIDPAIESPCMSVYPDLCVQEAIYVTTVNLPPKAGGYDLVYQRCCRNSTIVNIVNPAETGATYTAHIDDPGALVNSSPRFNSLPPVSLCAGFPFEYDHGASDPDGDELVYEFTTPFQGASSFAPDPDPAPAPPFDEVIFDGPFSESYPIESEPAFTINSATGHIEGTPTMLGQFVVGVRVKEYRDGVLIGEHFRDFQFNVTDCEPSAVASAPNVIKDCTDYSVSFENNSFGSEEVFWDFGIDGITTDTSTEFYPTYVFPDTGVYEVMLIVMPGTECSDTDYISVWIYPGFGADIGFDNTCALSEVAFTDLSYTEYGTITDWQWNYGDGWGSTEQNPFYAYEEPGEYMLIFTVTNSIGCVDEIYDTITIYPLPFAFLSYENACPGEIGTVSDASIIIGGNEIVDYEWITPDGDNVNAESFGFLFDSAGTYPVTLIVTSNLGCTDTLIDTIVVPEPVSAAELTDVTICEGDSIQLIAGGGEFYEWIPPFNISSASEQSPLVWPENTTTYAVVVSDVCSFDTAFVTINVLPAPDLVAGPDTIVYSNTPVQMYADGAMSYVWSPDFGLTDPLIPNPIATPDETVQYIITGMDESGCTAVDTALVYIIPSCFHYVTVNAFSPNGDGVNDKFRFVTNGDEELITMQIYNRWGDVIFETTDLENGWDGTDGNGREQEIGSYIYRLITVCDGIEQALSGSVTLLR
jgi:gliding motility-associated-like protein